MKPTVLIADNNTLNRKTIENMLSDEYVLLEVDDGVKALHAIKTYGEKLAAAILDLHMPGMNATEILREMADGLSFACIPTLIATEEDDPETEHMCLELGAWDFVKKPYDVFIIKLRLRNIIGRKDSSLINRIRYISQVDKLTGLYNRDYFIEQTSNMLRYHKDTTFAIIRMDINRFRTFNSSFGTAMGDEVLKSVSKYIKQRMKSVRKCTYGRIQSDVFVFCAPYNKEKIIAEISATQKGIGEYFNKFKLDLNFGIYVITKPEQRVEESYSFAVEAAKKCKETINTNYVIYDETMHYNQLRERQILSDMETAIEEHQFKLYLQPKFSLITERPCGAEALVRWEHPIRGLMMPGDFIPIFESRGLIDKLDSYMFETVCRVIRKWLNDGLEVEPISVNISRISLYNPNIVNEIIDVTAKYEVPHKLLQIEITESAYMSNPLLMQETIRNLRENGFTLLMDDFGSGYSSLNTLKDIEMDILKIDMKFLPSGDNHIKSQKILASVSRMASWIGMPVIVEGVETKEQKDFIISVGCNFAQGFYFSKPISLPEYEKFIMKYNTTVASRNAEEAVIDKGNLDVIWSADEKTGTILKIVSVPFAVLEYSESGVFALRMNQEYLKIFGESSDPLSFLDPDGKIRFRAALDRVCDGADEASCDCLYIFSLGSFRWYRVHFQPISNVANTALVGATFTDITAERTQELEIHHVLAAIKMPDTKKATILIVDDSAMTIEILIKLFESEYTVLTASNGREALEKLREHIHDIAVVLIDMKMPVMSGQELISSKNSIPEAADIPVVVISSETSSAMQVNLLNVGVADYITKPFVPEMVSRRVRNVLEHSNRFRQLVREYNDSILLETTKNDIVNRDRYVVSDINGMMHFMQKIFDVVRFVDPIEMVLLEFGEDGNVKRTPYSCYKVWGKEKRCENCSSLCASHQHCMFSKYEFIKNDIFYVISQPIRVAISDTESVECILEIVSHISDHIMMKEIGTRTIEKVLEDTKKQMYTDLLTEFYNRRYYDEMLFVTETEKASSARLGLMLFEIANLKSINEDYGQKEADEIMLSASKALKNSVTGLNVLIRYNKNEFVVIIRDCDQEEMKSIAGRLAGSISDIKFGKDGDESVIVHSGCAFTDCFNNSNEQLQNLFSEADMQKQNGRKKRKTKSDGKA